MRLVQGFWKLERAFAGGGLGQVSGLRKVGRGGFRAA